MSARDDAIAALDVQVADLDAQKDSASAAHRAAITALDDQIAAAYLAFEAAWEPLSQAENYQRMCRRWQDARRKWLERYAR